MSNVKQNIRNSVFSIADVIFYPLLFLLSVPFFMQQLGEDVFGIWMLMNSLMISFQIFNLGLAPAVVKYIALYRSRNENQNVNDTISTGIFISVALMITGMIIGLGLYVLIQNGYLFNLSPSLSVLAANCMIITSFIIGMKFIEQTLLNVFKGFERYDLYFLVNNSIRFIVLIINMIQVLYNKSLESMLIVNLAVTFMMLVLQLILISRLTSSYKLSIRMNKALSKELMRFGFYNWIQSLIIILVFQLDRYLIVSGFGPVQLGYYALVSTIFINIHSCFSATATWLIPKIVAHSQGSYAQKELYTALRAMVTAIGILTLSVFSILHKPLFIFWAGHEKFAIMKTYIRLFIAFEFFYLLLIAPSLYLTFSGHVKTGILITYITSLLNITGIILGFLFVKEPQGVIWGLIASSVVSMIIVYEIVNKLFLKRSFFSETLFFIALPGIASLTVWNNNYLVQLIIIIILVILCWLFFIRHEKNKLSVLFQ